MGGAASKHSASAANSGPLQDVTDSLSVVSLDPVGEQTEDPESSSLEEIVAEHRESNTANLEKTCESGGGTSPTTSQEEASHNPPASLSLGDRINSIHDDNIPVGKKHLVIVTLVLFACLGLINWVAYFLVDTFYLQRKVQPLSQDNNNLRVVQGRIIAQMQKWYNMNLAHDVVDYDIMSPERVFEPPGEAGRACTRYWYDFVSNATSASPFTSPQIIQDLVQDMGVLHNVPMVRFYLHDYLSQPMPWQYLLEQSETCASESQSWTAIACLLQTMNPNLLSKENEKELLLVLHQAVVVHQLAYALMQDIVTLQQVLDLSLPSLTTRTTKPNQRKMTQAVVDALSHGGATSSFVTLLQQSIFEAILLDDSDGNHANARLGLDLAVSLSSIEPTVENQHLEWKIGQAWADAYMGWMANLEGSVSLWGSLLAPSVVCSVTTASSPEHHRQAETFFQSHILSMLLHSLMLRSTETTPETNQELQLSISRALDIHVAIPRATPTQIHALLARHCENENGCPSNEPDQVTDSLAWISGLDDFDFQIFYGYIVWLTVMFAGYGFELLVFLGFLRHQRWSPSLERNWKLAQYAFSWLACTTLGLALYQNFTAVLTLVPGLWKFGFPEVVSYTHRALWAPRLSPLTRIAEFANGLGTLVHHGAASILIVMLLMGVIFPTRVVVTPILFLVMQHWFVLLTYVDKNVYVVLELLLEVGFQWSVFSVLEQCVALHWTSGIACFTMLMAHDLYLFAAVIELYQEHFVGPSRTKNLDEGEARPKDV